MDISAQQTRDMKMVKDLVTAWPMMESKVKAGEEGIHNHTPITENLNHEHFEMSRTQTWRISRLRLSRILILIPPVVRLARQTNLRTTWRSAPWAMRSSIADNCEETSYDASRSV